MLFLPHPLGLWTSTVITAPTVPVEPSGLIELIWHDTPDYYTTATEGRFWVEVQADCRVIPGAGYGGGSAWSGVSEDAYSLVYPPDIPAGADYFGIGLRLRLTGYPSTSLPLVAVVDDAGDRQVEVRIEPTGQVTVYRDSTLLATSADPLPTYSEIKFGVRGRVSSTVGEIDVRVAHGSATAFTPIIRLTNINTSASGAAVWTGIYLGRPPCWFTSHAYAGHGFGDLRPGYLVAVLRPDTLDETAWEASAGTVVTDIDDPTPDDDATFIYGQAVGQRYLVHPEAMEDVRAIYGVRSVALVKNAPGQSVTHAMTVGNGSAPGYSISPWRSVDDSDWTMVDRFDRRNPLTGDTWTPTSVSAVSYGGEVAA